MSTKPLSLRVRRESERCVLEVAGDLRDDVSEALGRVEGELKGAKGPVVIDCRGFGFINSFAMSQWTAFIKKLKGPLVFERCPAYLIDQINVVPALVGKGRVASFDAPYRCHGCQANFEAPFETARVDRKHGLPDVACPRCGAEVAPDVDRTSFLTFVRS